MGIEVQLDEADLEQFGRQLNSRDEGGGSLTRASRRTDIEVTLDEEDDEPFRRWRFFKKRRNKNVLSDADDNPSPDTTAIVDGNFSDASLQSLGKDHNESNNKKNRRQQDGEDENEAENESANANENTTSDGGHQSDVSNMVEFSIVDHDSATSSLTSSDDDDDRQLLDYEEQRRIFQDIEPYDDYDDDTGGLGKIDPFLGAIGSMFYSMATSWKPNENTDIAKDDGDQQHQRNSKFVNKGKDGVKRRRNTAAGRRSKSSVELASGSVIEDDDGNNNEKGGGKKLRSTIRRQRRQRQHQQGENVIPGAFPEIDDDASDEQAGFEAVPARPSTGENNGDGDNIQATMILPFAAELAPEMEDIIAERDSLRIELEDSKQRLAMEQQQKKTNVENGDGSSSLNVLPILVESVPVVDNNNHGLDGGGDNRNWHNNERDHNTKLATNCPCCTWAFCCRTMIPIIVVAVITFYVGNRIL